MTIKEENIIKFTNQIKDKYSVNCPDIRVSYSDKILLFRNNSKDTIEIGRYAITLMFLYSCFAQNKRLFKRILFFYYWTCRSLLEYKIKNAKYCFIKLCKIIQKKERRINGYALSSPIDILLSFIVGHETFHILFSHDSSLKNTSIDETVSFLNDVYKEPELKIGSKNQLIFDGVLKDINDDSSKGEEYACDRESLKFLFDYYTEGKPLDEDVFTALSKQLLDMVMMFQYDLNMTSLREGVFKIKNYERYLHRHIGMGILRLGCSAYTLEEIGEKMNMAPDVASYLKQSIKKQQKALSGLMTFRLTDLNYSICDDDFCDDFEAINELKKHLDEVSDYLNSLLLGEDLSAFQ